MTNDFGSEFKNILDLIQEPLELRSFRIPVDPLVADVDVRYSFERILALAEERRNRIDTSERGLIIYFPPGNYRLPHRSTDPGISRYEIPENVELFFCPGALLRPDTNVHLVIRGSIRAGKQQIFGYDRYLAPPSPVSEHNTVPQGRIILAGRRVPAVYPEWWGAPDRPSLRRSQPCHRLLGRLAGRPRRQGEGARQRG